MPRAKTVTNRNGNRGISSDKAGNSRHKQDHFCTDLESKLRIPYFQALLGLAPWLQRVHEFIIPVKSWRKAVTITEETPRNYREATQTLLSEAKELFLKLEDFDGDTTLDYLQDLDRLGFLIGDALGRAHLYTSTHPLEGVREAAENAVVELEQLATEVSMSPELFANLQKFDAKKSKGAALKFFEDTIVKFRRAGVDRDEKKRRMIVEFKDQLTKLGQDFGKNIREDIREVKVTADELKGLPADYIEAKTPDSDGLYKVTTDYPDYLPFMKYAENDDARRRLFIAFKQRVTQPTGQSFTRY